MYIPRTISQKNTNNKRRSIIAGCEAWNSTMFQAARLMDRIQSMAAVLMVRSLCQPKESALSLRIPTVKL